MWLARVAGLVAVCCVVQPAQTIVAYDCTNAQTVVASVDALNVGDCIKENVSDLVLKNQSIQLIQEATVTNMKVWHCKLEELTVVSHCGIHSHISAVQAGLQRNLIDISRSKCLKLHRDGYFQYRGTTIEGIKPNTTTERHITAYGILENDGTCYGAAFSTPTGTYTNAVMQVSIKNKYRR